MPASSKMQDDENLLQRVRNSLGVSVDDSVAGLWMKMMIVMICSLSYDGHHLHNGDEDEERRILFPSISCVILR